MDVGARFCERSEEVARYLKTLAQLESRSSSDEWPAFSLVATVAASRASAFIMIYNCVEDALRQAFTILRQQIEASGCQFCTLLPYWQTEIVKAHFERRLRQGGSNDNLMKDIVDFTPGKVAWKDRTDRLPFQGNVDNVRILKTAERMGMNWKPPPGTFGGADLTLIREQRNALAHGFETFESVGALFSNSDVESKLVRARLFVVSLLGALESYGERRLFERQG